MGYRSRMAQPISEDEWRALLTGEHPGLARPRPFFKHLPRPPRCKLCNVPFRGPLTPFLRRLGYRRWAKNPSICEQCLSSFQKRGLGGAEIELSFLFADVRGSTALAERVGPSAFTTLLNRFYDVATRTLVDADAVVDKFVGDEVVGLFVPGFAGPDHAAGAITAARRILRLTGHGDPAGPWIPVGIGVHTGVAFVGTVGSSGAPGSESSVADFTALGDPVNVTARLASVAGADELLITEASARAARLERGGREIREIAILGRRAPIVVWAERV